VYPKTGGHCSELDRQNNMVPAGAQKANKCHNGWLTVANKFHFPILSVL